MTDPAARIFPEGTGETLHVLGDTVTLRGPIAVHPAGEALFMADVTVPPGSGVPPHTHPSPETFRVLEGQVAFAAPGPEGLAETLAGPGDVVHVPPGAPHGYRNPGPAPARLTVILDAGMVAFFRAAASPAPLAGPPPPETVARILAIARGHGITMLVEPA